jgi:hypothetical protein
LTERLTDERLKKIRWWAEKMHMLDGGTTVNARALVSLLDEVEAQRKALEAADAMRDMARAHFAANRLVCSGHGPGADAIVAYDSARHAAGDAEPPRP